MSRNTRGTVRRRLSLLASSSMVATSLLSGAAALSVATLTPSAALAACTPTAAGNTGPGSGPTTSGGEYCIGSDTGIDYTANGDMTVLLEGAPVTAYGVSIGTTGAYNLTVGVITTTLPGGAIVNNNGGDGIYLNANGGSIDIKTGSSALGSLAGATVTGDNNGITASSNTAGNIDVTAFADVTGLAGDGIHLRTSNIVGGTGDVDVVTKSGVAVSGGVNGIYVYNDSGTVTVTTNGTVSGTTGDGIQVDSLGAVNVTTNAAVTGGDDGVLIFGNSAALTTNAAVSGGTGDGIHIAVSSGGAIVTTNAAVSSTSGDGIDITSGGGISLTTNAAVIGDPGVVLVDNSAVGITYDANADVTGTLGGILATENGSGDVTINVNNSGTDVAGGGGVGVGVYTTGAGATTVTSDYGTTITGATGVLTTATGVGATDIDVYGTIKGTTADAINASNSGFGNVTATLGAFSTATGATNGIVVSTSYGNATANVGFASSVTANNGTGVSATSNANFISFGTATVNLDAFSSVTAKNGDGVVADVEGNYGVASVVLGYASTVTVTGTGSHTGVAAIANDGNLGGAAGSASVTGDDFVSVAVSTSGGSNVGIKAQTIDTSGGGSAVVDIGDFATVTVSGGASGNVGAEAISSSGSASLTFDYGATITVTSDAATGVLATAGAGGDATVTLGDAGSITVNDGGVNGNSVGVKAASLTGDATVTIGTTSVNVDDGTGILASATSGAVTVSTSGDVNTTNGDGVNASNTGAGVVTVNQYAGAITSVSGNGINASTSGTGGIVINTSLGSSIEADTVGFDDITAVSSGTAGDVTVNSFGVLSPIGFAGDSAVDAEITNALSTGDVTVNVENASWSTTGPGILATNAGLGAVSVDVGGLHTGFIDNIGTTGGIDASITNALSTSDVDVNVGEATGVTTGGVYSFGSAIIVSNSGTGDVGVTIGTGSQVWGLGDATHAVIDVTTTAGATATITNGGLIRDRTGISPDDSALAILATGGNLVVSNTATGTLDGRIDASASATATITNAGVWNTSGTSTLTAGADTITNASTGVINANANGVTKENTTFDFGAGNDSLTNAGVINLNGSAVDNTDTATFNFATGNDTLNNQAGGVINSGTAAKSMATTFNFATAALDAGTDTDAATNAGTIKVNGTLTFTFLDTFANSGAINAALDNTGNDVVSMVGTKFTGSGSSLLSIDADLWSTAQAGCTTPTVADCFVFGSTAGSTQIKVNDTNAHPFGAYNPTGITVVAGSSAASNFSLASTSEWFNAGGTAQFGGATNVLDKPGLFFYDLAFDSATNRELLIGVPKATVFEFSALGGASSDLWYSTTQSWFDRQADLRDTISGRAAGGAPAVWLKVVGDWTRRTQDPHTLTLFNKTYTFDTGYNQDTAEIIGGIDFLNVTAADHAWVLGVQGGYVDSNVRFKTTADRANITGSTLGVYGSYVSGPLFVDAIVNGNFFSLDMNLPIATVPPATPSGDVRNWGGQVETGYAIPIGSSSFFEPVGSLAYARTSFDDLSIPGGTVAFNDADSFRGSLGARIGTTAAYQYYKIKLALEGRVWDEWDGKTTTNLTVAGGPDILVNDQIDGVFGEVKGEANLFAVGNKLSAFLNGGVKWKTHYQSATVTLGMRYQW